MKQIMPGTRQDSAITMLREESAGSRRPGTMKLMRIRTRLIEIKVMPFIALLFSMKDASNRQPAVENSGVNNEETKEQRESFLPPISNWLVSKGMVLKLPQVGGSN